MRIAIDVSALSTGLTSGTGVYVYRLVKALSAARPEDEFWVLYNGLPGVGARLTAQLEARNVRAAYSWLRWRPLPAPVFWRPYPSRLRAVLEHADLFHVGEFVYPRPRPDLAVVATVHDVTTKLFPHWHGYPNRILHRRRLNWIRRYATRILIDAAATRRDVCTELGASQDNVDVVPLARGLDLPARVDQSGIDAVRARSGIGGSPYVLYVGTLEPRKNLVRLVEAFLRLAPEFADYRLVLAGAWGWRVRRLRRAVRDSGGRVLASGPVTEDDLRALYAGAKLFAYPSLYEGFGLPVLEAMAAGVAVLTSAGGTLEEVANGAAALVNPEDVDAIAAAMQRLLGSAQERDQWRARGFEREREFTWERTAELTYEAYRRAVAACHEGRGRS